jgi:cytochrome c oxidase assembly factor CtaG
MRRLFLLMLAMPSAALAHGGAHPVDGGPPGWTSDTSVIMPLLLSAFLYGAGLARLWRRSEGGRAYHARNAALFAAGWLILAGAIVSPLHEAGERSFTLHMIEHELIMVAAAPLLALARPLVVMIWAFPTQVRQGLAKAGLGMKQGWTFLTHPVTATLLQVLVLIAWHGPPIFNRALGHAAWHVAQHLSFLVSALIFWWAMARRWEGARGYMLSAFCLFATSLVGGMLGALMSFAGSPWYASYAALGMTPYGLTPVEDQQLAGLVMWIPGGMVHAGASLLLLVRVLRREAAHASG